MKQVVSNPDEVYCFLKQALQEMNKKNCIGVQLCLTVIKNQDSKEVLVIPTSLEIVKIRQTTMCSRGVMLNQSQVADLLMANLPCGSMMLLKIMELAGINSTETSLLRHAMPVNSIKLQTGVTILDEMLMLDDNPPPLQLIAVA